MVTKPKSQDGKTPAQHQAADRAKVRKAGVLDELLDTFRTGVIRRYDADQKTVIAYDQISPEVRVALGEKLVRKIVPDLKSVELSGDAGVHFTIQAGFPIPGSQRPSLNHPDDAKLIEGHATVDDLETGLRAAQARQDARHAPEPFDGPEPPDATRTPSEIDDIPVIPHDAPRLRPALELPPEAKAALEVNAKVEAARRAHGPPSRVRKGRGPRPQPRQKDQPQ